MKVVVIGGVAAGMSAASRLKRSKRDEVSIVVYEKGGTVSYGACGIPFFISDHIKDEAELIARTPEQFEASGISVKTYHEVTEVDTEHKLLKGIDKKTGQGFTDTYDKLVIGSGASVRHFPPFDRTYSNLYEVRNTEDGRKIKDELYKEEIKSVLITGGGFIGLEVAESCKKFGKEVTVVELAPHVLSNFDPEVSEAIEEELQRNGIEVKTGWRAEAVTEEAGAIKEVVLVSGETRESRAFDLVINCAGIAPNTSFIPTVEKAKNGAILVNERMETNIPDVYAGGDCSIMRSAITGEYTYAPLGSNANKQGRIIADVIAGKEPKAFKLIGCSALRLFGMDAAKVGLSEKEAASAGIPYKTNLIEGNSYASYYGKEKLSIKVVYEQESRKILGVQTYGQGIVVPRANYYAVAIHAGMTVDEMGYMDLCYSPPFGGVWDAALIAANTAK